MLNLSLTFDYELFFGENNGTYDEVLFDYTYKLIDALKKKGISATFFADVCSVPVAEKYSQDSYVDGFKKQIRYMAEHGQDVQLHIHPHWYYSKWEDGKWQFTNRGYRIHEYIEDGRINSIVEDGVSCLNDILKPVNQDYQCIAYRAGGFSIQPHKEVVKALLKNGIRVDSSVAPHLAAKTEAQIYDYRHSIKRLNWHISDKDEWYMDCKEGNSLLEIPIATTDKNPISFATKRLFEPQKIKLDTGQKRGSYIAIHTETKRGLKKYWEYVSGYNTISMDAYAAEYLYSQVKRLHRKSDGEGQTVALIGHPKLVTDKYIDNLCRFIDVIKEDNRFGFASIYEAYEREY